MRIDSMDASFNTTAGLTAAQGRPDLAVKHTVVEEKPQSADRLSEAFIMKAVDKANRTMQEHGRSLEFKIHEKTNEVIVKIIDTDTKEVIREIPSEKILDMFANMLELAGLLVDERR